MDILVVGGQGQIGHELRRLASDSVRVVAPERDRLDLTRPDVIARAIRDRAWSVVINAAAYTDVEAAESEVAEAWSVNALGPAVLAGETGKAGIPLVHVSTDYVFDGRKPGWYDEADGTGPLNVYGGSKLGGEFGVQTANPRHVILRSAWIFSSRRKNFVKTVLRLATERPVLRIVDDQHGCPTSAVDVAGALWTVARRLAEDPDAPVGTYHFVNSGEATWHGLAGEILAHSRRRGGPWAELEAISSVEYQGPAKRPANSRLSTRKIEHDFGVAPRPWPKALADVVDALIPAPAKVDPA